MLCTDTGSLEAVHFEHLDARSMGKLNKIIEYFKQLCHGNGRVNVVVTNGKIQFFEPTTRIPNDDKQLIN